MIKTFDDKNTERLFQRNLVKKFPSSIVRSAYRKLLIIDASSNLDDLRIPPGNRLEKLSGKMSDYYSIRINNQWRIIFKWKHNDAYEVKIIDYHKG